MKQDKNFDFNPMNKKNQHSNPKGEIINSEAMKFNQIEILKSLELENYLKKYINGTYYYKLSV